MCHDDEQLGADEGIYLGVALGVTFWLMLLGIITGAVSCLG